MPRSFVLYTAATALAAAALLAVAAWQLTWRVDEPALFWLDAHYAGPLTARGMLDSPIVQELDAIRAHPVAGHVVLIDDMRYFTGTDGYPRAVDLVQWIRSDEPRGSVEIRDDILRWHMRMA